MSNIVDKIHDMIEEAGSEEAWLKSMETTNNNAMKEYTVYFEIFGKKMKTTVRAFNEEQAKAFVKNKIVFHKVEKVINNPIEDFLKGFAK